MKLILFLLSFTLLAFMPTQSILVGDYIVDTFEYYDVAAPPDVLSGLQAAESDISNILVASESWRSLLDGSDSSMFVAVWQGGESFGTGIST